MKHPFLSARALFVLTIVAAICAGCGLATAQTTATETVIANFNGTNGATPAFENLVQGRDGNLYGTTEYGGANGYGTVFRITPVGVLTTLYSFTGGSDGIYPVSGLVLGADGNFYGTTFGQDTDWGTVFAITPSGTLTTLHNFSDTDGADPVGALIQAFDGNFYGTTSYGGTPYGFCGTTFKISPTGAFTSLYTFGGGADGCRSNAALLQTTDGHFWGANVVDGAINDGVIFETNSAGVPTTFIQLEYIDYVLAAAEPEGSLLHASDGYLYGTSFGGGLNLAGAVYKLSRATGTLSDLYSFLGTSDGCQPRGSLVQANDGNLYGTTSYCGSTSNFGTVFQVTLGGTLTTLHNFTGSPGDGFWPWGGLVQHTSGVFYGKTACGGSAGDNRAPCYGIVYSLNAGLKPFVRPVPGFGKVGSKITILGTGLKGVTSVTFNGVAAAFTSSSSTYLTASVPSGATSGTIKVTTSGRTLKSNGKFLIIK